MSNLLTSLRSQSISPLSFEEFQKYFSFNGLSYPLTSPQPTIGSKQEEIRGDFRGMVEGAYKSNGIIFACAMARLLLFSEARFKFRRQVLGRPGELFGTKALTPLEEPWPGATTGRLLARMSQDTDIGGNFFGALRPGGRIRRLRPDWVTIILGSPNPNAGFGDIDVEVLGYSYQPGGPNSSNESIPLLAEQVAHYAPIPDPLAEFRGMSWITPVIREVMGDAAATTHKLQYFEQGATPAMVVNMDASIEREAFERWAEYFRENYEGVDNAHKTMLLGGGSKAEVVGSDLKSIDFAAVQAQGEARIASAAGVPPPVVGLKSPSDGLTYENVTELHRQFADRTIWPMWREAAGVLAQLIQVPAGSELWIDARDINFLHADAADEADVQKKEAETIDTLIASGFTPESTVQAVQAGDMSRLIHRGNAQPQGSEEPNSNGSGDPSAVPALPSGD